MVRGITITKGVLRPLRGKLLWMLCAVCVFVFLSGCQRADDTGGEEELYIQNYTVSLYYANAEYIDTGDESVPRLHEPLEIKIRSLPQDVYADVINYLKQEPQGEEYVTLVPETLNVNSVVLEEGTAIIDLDGRELSGGSMQEMFTIAQIVNSLLASFHEIDKVQFTVDGALSYTLMGHMVANEPFYWQDL